MVVGRMSEFLRSPKSPGLITLNHENSAVTVGGFITSFPQIASNGWTFTSLAQALSGGQSYQNAQSSISDVTKKGVLNQVVSSSTTSTSASPTTASPTASSLPSGRQRSAASSSHALFHLQFSVVVLSTLFAFLS